MILRRIGLGAGLILILLAAWLGFAATGYPSALKPPREAPAAILISDVRVVSMAPGAPEAEDAQDVLIEDGVISAVGPAGSLAAPEDALVIEGDGLTLTPGLIDAHVHVWDEAELAGYLAHGVTGIRNLSGMPFHLPLIERIEAGRILGPDMISSGPILNSPGVNAQANHQMVLTADEARAAVAQQDEDGYRLIKVYSNLHREAYDAAMDEAQKRGMAVTGHSPEGAREEGMPYDKPFDIVFEESLGKGFQTIEHVETIVWHGLRDDLDAEKMRALAEKIAASGDVVTPTLTAHDNLMRVAQTKGAYLTRPGTETINPLLKMFEQGGYEYWASADVADYGLPHRAFHLKSTKMLHDAGVPLVAGTDAGIFVNIPGSALTRELELLVEAGLTPYEALQTATVNAGDVLGFEKTGQIAPGFRANLILVDGDPLSDVSVVENPRAVILRGVYLDTDKLEDLRKGAGQTSLPRSARRAIAMFRSL